MSFKILKYLNDYHLNNLLIPKAGIYILQLMDTYCVPYSAFFIAFFEIMAITWVYGVDRLLDNIKQMLGVYPFPRLYWKIMWKFGCPIIILVSDID